MIHHWSVNTQPAVVKKLAVTSVLAIESTNFELPFPRGIPKFPEKNLWWYKMANLPDVQPQDMTFHIWQFDPRHAGGAIFCQNGGDNL